MDGMKPIIAINAKSKPSKSNQDDLHDEDNAHNDNKHGIIAQVRKNIFLWY